MKKVQIGEFPELERLDRLADLLDDRFRIPGTRLRFGLDAVFGLIPYVGDVLTFLVSGYLVTILARRGASGMLVLKMIRNIFLDGVIGTVPFFGDIFDFRYRANMKNIRLMHEFYRQGEHHGSGKGVLLLILLLILALVALSVWVMWRILFWVFS